MNLLSKKMGHLSNLMGQEDKLLEFFYEHPTSSPKVRELATKTKISRSSVQYKLTLLKKAGIISSGNQWINSWQNRLLKINYYTEKIALSGLIDYLDTELAASAIILFGSFRKGESMKESDIDLFVECAREKKIDLSSFEKKLSHKIQLFTRPKITLLPTELMNNVVNGIKLKGYFKLK